MARPKEIAMLGPQQLMDCDPWKIDAADWPSQGTPHEKLIFLLNYAVLAPSILNTQPWQFYLADGSLRLDEDPSRRMSVVDPEGRESTISCGAALMNLHIAARGFGHDVEIEIMPKVQSANALAAVRLQEGPRHPSETDRRLRDAIKIRRTMRAGFDQTPVDPNLLEQLAKLASRHDVALTWVTAPERKRAVAEIVADAERVHLSDPQFRQELRLWLQQRRSEDHESLRELHARMGPASGHSPQGRLGRNQATVSGADMARTFATPESASASQYALTESSPVLVLLATAGDSRGDWLSAGQALQLVLLAATDAGLSASYLNPPIELPHLRRETAAAFDTKIMPQVLLRLGHGKSISPTPRRTIREVLTLSASVH
jgi:nitroreductase